MFKSGRILSSDGCGGVLGTSRDRIEPLALLWDGPLARAFVHLVAI